ncbi:MFS transporter, partial [Nocardioides sp. NPDC000441]
MPLALYLLALAVFVMGTSEFMLAGLVPAIAADLDVSVGTAGLLTSAFAVGIVVGAPVMAAFARRWPPRLALLVCLLVFAGCHVLGAVTPAFPLLLAARVLSAFANAGFLAVALSAATRLVPEDRKGRALAILLSGTTIAMVAGVPAGALLGTAAGWRTTFWAIALLCVPATIGILRGVGSAPGATAADGGTPG